MYLKNFEYFILDSSVAGTLLLMALAIRIEAINAGFDQFSSNIIFISVLKTSISLLGRTCSFHISMPKLRLINLCQFHAEETTIISVLHSVASLMNGYARHEILKNFRICSQTDI